MLNDNCVRVAPSLSATFEACTNGNDYDGEDDEAKIIPTTTAAMVGVVVVVIVESLWLRVYLLQEDLVVLMFHSLELLGHCGASQEGSQC